VTDEPRDTSKYRKAAHNRAAGRVLSAFPTGGFVIASSDSGDRQGMTAHRGVLAPGEYVDDAALRAELERHLGVSMAEFDAAYRKRGRPTGAALEIRRRVDQVFLSVVEHPEANVELLARLLGINDSRIYEAAARARKSVMRDASEAA
jgi:hypothetical protein